MPAISTTCETSQSTATEFEVLTQSPAWEAFDGWLSDELDRLEATWQAASSPNAWNEVNRRSRRTVNR